MERKIGEIFEFGGEWYQCINTGNCSECAFTGKRCYDFSTKGVNIIGDCSGRTFKKLEKVGEPYEYFMQGTGTILVQEYILASQSYICGDEVIDCQKDGRVAIEIKQNKEDMKENKTNWREADTPLTRLVDRYVNNLINYDTFEKGVKKLYSDKEEIKPTLKEFDLEAAKLGKPVCTRDGRKARIICFDAKDTQPIIGLYEKNIDGIVREYLCSYHTDGRMYDDQDTGYDLMMLPEKKEGWVNVYRDCDGANITKDDNIYSSKDAAIASAQIIDGDNYIATTIIKWKE